MRLIFLTGKKLLGKLYKELKDNLEYSGKSHAVNSFYCGWAWSLYRLGMINHKEYNEAVVQISLIMAGVELKKGGKDEKA